MSATRIVGIPCAAFPDRARGFRKWLDRIARRARLDPGDTAPAVALIVCGDARCRRIFHLLPSALGSLGYVYADAAGRMGDQAGLSSPSLSREAIAGCSAAERSYAGKSDGDFHRARNFRRRRPLRVTARDSAPHRLPTRIGFYFCASIIFYISVSGVASVQMESMLRYEFCAHALIVLAFLHFLHQFRLPPVLVAGVRHGDGCASQCGRAQLAGLVRLEFYEGKLGCLTD